jgi:hypothetical protein
MSYRLRLWMVLATGMVCAVASHPISRSESPIDEYVFLEDTERKVGLYRNGSVLVGKLDRKGNFLQEKRCADDTDPGVRECKKLIGYTEPTSAYEFRSGRLIDGFMQPSGIFVPSAGSKVIPFSDYRYQPGSPPIWNLPGEFKKVDQSKARDRYNR